MSRMQRWYQSAAGRRAAADWWAAGVIDGQGAARAREFYGTLDGAAWLAFWRRVCAWLGVVLLAAAAICLVAANWDGLSRWAKLGGLQTLLAITVAAAVWPRAAPWVQTLALVLASMLLGALLALVGQIYQTGADPWQLFAGWALLMLPWAWAGRSVSLWLFWLLVTQVAWALWFDPRPGRGDGFLPGFVLINLLALAFQEAGRLRYAWLRRDAGPRLVAAALLAVSGGWAALAASVLVRGDRGALGWWAVAAALTGFFYYAARRDLAILAMVLASVIVVATGQCAAWLFAAGLDGVASFAVLALLVLASGTLAGAWLRRLAKAPARGGEGDQ